MKYGFIFIFFLKLSYSQVYVGNAGLIGNNGLFTYFNLTISNLNYNLDSAFGLKKVNINVQHPDVQQLYIYLKSPSGVIVGLTIGNSSNGVNFTNTSFDDLADTSITLVNAPFTGTYKPIGRLGRVNNGSNANGNWQLIIHDYLANIDQGTLLNWSLEFGNNPTTGVKFNSSALPIVVINTNNRVISDNETVVNMGIIDNGSNRNYITDTFNNYNGKIEINHRGHSSKDFEKKSYTIHLIDSNRLSINRSLLGMPAENDWVLTSFYQDKTLMRDPLTYFLYQKSGHYSPRNRYVELMLNNEYRGIYSLTEKVKRDSNRVDISNLDSLDNYYPDISGGYILKIDRADEPGWFSAYPGNTGGVDTRFYYQYVYPKADEITIEQKNYIKTVLDSFEFIMNSNDFSDQINGYSKYIDLSSFVDYFIFVELSKNVDGYRFSNFLYKEKITKGGKIHLGPLWDYNLAWHNCNYGDAFNESGWQYLVTDTVHPSPIWWLKFSQDSVFLNHVFCRWQNLRQTVLSKETIFHFIDSVSDLLNEARVRNFIQWPLIGAAIFPNPQNQWNTSYEDEIDDLKNWIEGRLAWLDWAIRGHCPVGTSISQFAQNYSGISVFPNPMFETAAFNVQLKTEVKGKLIIKDIHGRTVLEIFNGIISSGGFTILFDRKKLSSGIYYYSLELENERYNGKLIMN